MKNAAQRLCHVIRDAIDPYLLAVHFLELRSTLLWKQSRYEQAGRIYAAYRVFGV
ncbi:hypothetical protein D3C72_2582820 [compost metagenome]